MISVIMINVTVVSNVIVSVIVSFVIRTAVVSRQCNHGFKTAGQRRLDYMCYSCKKKILLTLQLA